MAEKLFARQSNDGLWQWRVADANGDWVSDVYHTGDNEALAEAARSDNFPLTILLPGESVVSTTAEIDAKEKRHLAKLLPYELEEEVIGNVDEMHIAHTFTGANTLAVAYIANNEMEAMLKPLHDAGCDVRVVLPDYIAVRRDNGGATLIMDDHKIIVRNGEYSGFSIETVLAPIILSNIDQELDFAATIHLVADSEDQLNRLESWLPEAWTHEQGPEVTREIGGFWDWIDTGNLNKLLDLRCGNYSRQIPLKRWALLWKTPLIAIAAAYIIAIVVGFSEYQVAKGEHKAIVAEMNDVYMKAVPKGRPGDPEGRLKGLVSGIKGGGGGEPSNLMVLLAGVASDIKASNITVSSMRYNADQRELMMNIEGDSFGALESLRSSAEKKGFTAELMRVEARGDKQSARIKVSEAGQ